MSDEISKSQAALIVIRDLVALILKTNTNPDVNQKGVEVGLAILTVQSAIMDIQVQNHELRQQNGELKQQLANMKNWNGEKERYSLTQIADGVFVYALKKEHAGDAPSHWLCANCFQKNQKAILQRAEQDYKGTYYSCPNCEKKIYDHSNPRQPEPQGRLIRG